MSEHSFDKYVRDKLSNYASPVPDGLWEKIAQEKKRKPFIFWWNSKAFLLLGLLITTLAIGGFMLFQKQQVLAKQETDLNPITATSAIEINKEKSTSKAITQKVKTVETNEQNASDKTSDVSTKITSSKSAQTNQHSTTNNQTNIAANKSDFLTNAKIETIDNKVVAQKSYTKNYSLKKKANTGIEKQDGNTKFLTTHTTFTKLDKDEVSNNFIFSKAKLQPINWLTPVAGEKNANGLQVNLFKPKDCPEVNGDYRNDWYLEMFGSPDYVIKTTTGSDNNAAFLAKKDSSEMMRGGFTVGARLSKNLNDNILLKAGIQFSQLNEKLSLRRENERRVITVVTIKTVTDASGNVSTVSDTSTIIQIGYVESNSYNYYRNIELPISLSYEMGNKNFKTAINAGVIVNLASWYKGKVLDTSFQMVNVNPKENDGITKHSVGLSLYGSISFIKPVNDRADIFAEPYFRYSLSKLQNTAYNFSQRFSALGLTLGIRYKLNYRKQHY